MLRGASRQPSRRRSRHLAGPAAQDRAQHRRAGQRCRPGRRRNPLTPATPSRGRRCRPAGRLRLRGHPAPARRPSPGPRLTRPPDAGAARDQHPWRSRRKCSATSARTAAAPGTRQDGRHGVLVVRQAAHRCAAAFRRSHAVNRAWWTRLLSDFQRSVEPKHQLPRVHLHSLGQLEVLYGVRPAGSGMIAVTWQRESALGSWQPRLPMRVLCGKAPQSKLAAALLPRPPHVQKSSSNLTVPVTPT
jgi:hypothetical protein